jgi:hypothetical protein
VAVDDAHTEVTTQMRIDRGIAHVERFFGAEFPDEFEIAVLESREAFSALARQRWGIPDTQCWMVGIASGSVFGVLDPGVWETDACEHDGDDATHVQRLITHELTHVYHGQHNPSPEFDDPGFAEVGWYAEGLAVFVSGQFDAERLAQAREVLEAGSGPERLRDAWSGEARYAIAGSIVAYLEDRYGRGALRELMGVTREAQLFEVLGVEEEGEILEGWREWVVD